jgi:hypothetical protein
LYMANFQIKNQEKNKAYMEKWKEAEQKVKH